MWYFVVAVLFFLAGFGIGVGIYRNNAKKLEALYAQAKEELDKLKK